MSLSAQNMYRTACQGNLVRLDSMLTNTTIDIKDERGRSLLHWAVACKQKEVFDFLINNGIKINEVDNQRKTPLHVAV
ncbi:MAG: ankyrin repeat domain-containing protein, partial [Psychroserpens sp.]|nr:ankyrin repeat domain-containing protein [Psychroserpens sp.]